MNRKDFLKSGTLAGAVTLLTSNNAFYQNLADYDIDKRTDTNENYILKNQKEVHEGSFRPFTDLCLFVFVKSCRNMDGQPASINIICDPERYARAQPRRNEIAVADQSILFGSQQYGATLLVHRNGLLQKAPVASATRHHFNVRTRKL